jgi:hypothetical protein
MTKKATLQQMWVVAPFQRGSLDDGEALTAYSTEAAAMEAARDWAEDVCYDESTEHECVVMKAIVSFRGKKTVTKFEPVLAKSKPADTVD